MILSSYPMTMGMGIGLLLLGIVLRSLDIGLFALPIALVIVGVGVILRGVYDEYRKTIEVEHC